MKNRVIIFILLITVLASCKQDPLKKKATIVFYNVENLFDTINDPTINDDEFLPDSVKKWNSKRYNKKLSDIAKVLSSINEEELPELIGVCEIENRLVLDDLAKTGLLATGNYQIIHIDSPDKRGIDVALLYRKGEFKELAHEALLVNPGFATRDILHVFGKLGKDKIHLFINHWPSRWGGMEKSEPNRIIAAQTLKNKVDEILQDDPNAKIVIMGDMNDEPNNKSLSSVLQAKAPGLNSQLYNLMIPINNDDIGSYNYQKNWNMLDNFIVSKSVLHSSGFTVNDQVGHIFHQAWMEYNDKTGNMSPSKTYGGPNYFGGISDHFPVYIQLTK